MTIESLYEIIGEPTENEIKIAEMEISYAKTIPSFKKSKFIKAESLKHKKNNNYLTDPKVHLIGDRNPKDLDYLNDTTIRKHPSVQDSYIQTKKAQKFEENSLPHRKGIETIINNPENIGVNEKLIGMAFPMHNQGINRFDILFEGNNHRYIIKYAVKNSSKKRNLARHQLIETKELMNKKYKNKPTKMLYISGENFMAQELTEKGLESFNYTPRQ